MRTRIIDFPQLSFLHDTRFPADREYNLIVEVMGLWIRRAFISEYPVSTCSGITPRALRRTSKARTI
jgi:hypothetical protein